MKRRRTIASAPRRSASEAWDKIAALVCDTLERSPEIERTSVEAVLNKAAGVGRMLAAGGHLESEALVLVGGDLYVEIQTVSGTDALKLGENLNPILGGAGAGPEWKLHLPPCEPLAKLVREAAKQDQHLSSDTPSEPVEQSARTSGAVLDEAALARWAGGGS